MECTMNDKYPLSSVIAGIDGSQTAIHAAQWAIDEAVSRRVPLRLVYVTKATHPSADDYYEDVHHGEASLRAAQAAMDSVGTPVKVETAIVTGPPGPALVAESSGAEMICVGSVGIGRYARSILGSTATELAENAHCPVAVIRPQEDESRPDNINWIVVAINDEPDNELVIEHAMEEAKLRHAPVLALGNRQAGREALRDGLEREVDKWKGRYPDVHIYPVANRADVAHFLKKHNEPIQLAVIGSSKADELAQIIGHYGHAAIHHAVSSVLVVRRKALPPTG
jgi:nucleotide-binding universal stress UspA family protein